MNTTPLLFILPLLILSAPACYSTRAGSNFRMDLAHYKNATNLPLCDQAHHCPLSPADYERARKEYKTLCDQGILLACTSLGTLHMYGLRTPADPFKAWDIHIQACKGGLRVACANLVNAPIYLNFHLLRQLQDTLHIALQRRPEDTAIHAIALRTRILDATSKTSLQSDWSALQTLCNVKDEPQACLALAHFHHNAITTPRDLRTARDLYEKSCTLGHPIGCDKSAFLRIIKTLDTNTQPQDITDDLDVLNDICNRDTRYKPGCRNHTKALLRAKYTPQAIQTLRARCARFHPTTCHTLARILTEHEPNTPHLELLKLHQKACDYGHPSACAMIGYSYDIGLYTSRDPTQALAFHKKTCTLDPLRCDAHKELQTRLQSSPNTSLKRRCEQYGDPNACTHYAQALFYSGNIQHAHTRALNTCDPNTPKTCDPLINTIQHPSIDTTARETTLFLRNLCIKHRSPKACHNAAFNESHGTGTPPNASNAQLLWDRACNLGYTRACIHLPKRPAQP